MFYFKETFFLCQIDSWHFLVILSLSFFSLNAYLSYLLNLYLRRLLQLLFPLILHFFFLFLFCFVFHTIRCIFFCFLPPSSFLFLLLIYIWYPPLISGVNFFLRRSSILDFVQIVIIQDPFCFWLSNFKSF